MSARKPARNHARIGQKGLRGHKAGAHAFRRAMAHPIGQHRDVGMSAAHQYDIKTAHGSSSNSSTPAGSGELRP